MQDAGGQPQLAFSPGRIDPGNAAWAASRKPLVGQFSWQGRPFFVIANHFDSKGGDQPIFGHFQQPARSSEIQRHQQATEVRAFVDQIQAVDRNARVVVLGDLNDFEFSQTADILVGGHGRTALTDLPRTLPRNQRYTYVFDGNSQVLDHILLTKSWASVQYDIVHTNSEFHDQDSDHDPQVVRLRLSRPAGPGNARRPPLVDPGVPRQNQGAHPMWRIRRRSMQPTDRSYAVQRTDEDWREQLSPAEYRVLREAGTERAFTGEYTDTKTQGVYACRACGTELFRSDTKFESHCGWPSFYSPLAGDTVEYIEDVSMGMKRVEVRCANCGSHLGHVFEGEGYDTPTDQRFCINSISLTAPARRQLTARVVRPGGWYPTRRA